MSSILHHDYATYNVYHVVCDRNTTIDKWSFFLPTPCMWSCQFHVKQNSVVITYFMSRL